MENRISQLHQILSSHYKENNENLQAIEELILATLKQDQRILGGKLITEVKIKSKQRPKFFKDIYPGQVFELFFESIQKYAYGVIVEGDLTIDKDADVIIAYLDVYTDDTLSINEIFYHIENKRFIMIANSGYYSIRNYLWKYVCQFPSIILSAKELSTVCYSINFMDKYYKSVGDSTKEIAECIRIEEQEARDIPNPLGIVGDLEIEELLCDFYSRHYSKR